MVFVDIEIVFSDSYVWLNLECRLWKNGVFCGEYGCWKVEEKLGKKMNELKWLGKNEMPMILFILFYFILFILVEKWELYDRDV